MYTLLAHETTLSVIFFYFQKNCVVCNMDDRSFTTETLYTKRLVNSPINLTGSLFRRHNGSPYWKLNENLKISHFYQYMKFESFNQSFYSIFFCLKEAFWKFLNPVAFTIDLYYIR